VPDTNVQYNIGFIEQHERAVVKQALHAITALRDGIDLRREIGLPVLAETRDAIVELEDQVASLRVEMLRAPQADS
jgi:hypothetical protein